MGNPVRINQRPPVVGLGGPGSGVQRQAEERNRGSQKSEGTEGNRHSTFEEAQPSKHSQIQVSQSVPISCFLGIVKF